MCIEYNIEILNGVFNAAQDYLLSFDGVDEEAINSHLYEYNARHNQINSLNDVYRGFLESARSGRHMPNVIDNINALREHLFDFDPNSIIQEYQNDYAMLFARIAPPGTENIPHNSWVKFCKSAISSANFLSQFNSFNDFSGFVNSFTANPLSRIGLPLLLKEEIFGFGFALACDFIKENLSPEYIKPDTHIIDIFKGIGLSRQIASDYEIFKDAIRFSEIINKEPYVIDKLFWLIGSGKFYLNDFRINTLCLNIIE